MSKIRLSGSNSGYVEIAAAADAGNLTFTMPTTGTALFGNGNNVISGITTFSAALDINSNIDVSGTSVFNNDVTFDGATAGYDVVWDRSDNQLEFANNAKASFGNSGNLQIYSSGTASYIHENATGNLRILGSNLRLATSSNNPYMFMTDGAGIEMYHNASKKIETTPTGAVVTGICTATSFSGSGENLTRTTQLSHRNVIINGDMRIAQRATSHNSSGYRTIDRFKMTAGGASHTLTQAQVDVASGTSPYVRGFRKAFSITNAGQNANNQGYVYMLYEIEAQDIATCGWRYMYNTSGDDYITVSFWVKASVAQTYLFFIHTGDGTTKEWNHLMSLSANVWTKVTIPIPGNSGITINNDTGAGLRLYWCAYLGDHYTSTGSVDQWVTHAGYTSRPDMGAGWWTTSNATFQLTGVQLEVGEQATPFEHKRFSDELKDCQRYYQQVVGYSDMVCVGPGRSNGTTHAPFTVPLSVPLRASPTLNPCSWAVFTSNNQSNSASQTPAVTKWDAHNNVLTCQLAGLSGMTNGRALNVFLNSSHTFMLDAEL